MRRPAIGLRAKLALVAACLLPMPWVGYLYVQEMERLLLEGQQQALIATARAVATALHDRPALMRLAPRDDSAIRREAEAELRTLAQARSGEAPAAAEERRGSPESAEAPAALPPPAQESEQQNREINAILLGLERNAARIRVINRDYRLLSITGSIEPAATPAPYAEGVEGAMQRLVRPLLALVAKPPAPARGGTEPQGMAESSREVTQALRGLPEAHVRTGSDGNAVIVSAAHPIWAGDEVLGAVVVEETTRPILSLRNRALERLAGFTLVVFGLGAAVLLGFANRLSTRIRALRDEAENAVDARGRITRLASGSSAGDEIGDLSRSFSSALEKLGHYHAYLETMASRLSHELRTPIAVVRSSLENLRMQPPAEDAQVYLARAEDGVRRLSTILARMSEASRLEHSLRGSERERYDLVPVVTGCVEGYRQVYPGHRFEWQAPPEPVMVSGSPDLAAQMLDKLASNAADFAPPGTAITLSIGTAGGQARLSVANEGPSLTEEQRGRLFTSLVSFRAQRPAGEPHLGLGLYVVRLIAEYHGGTAGIDNHDKGVRAWVRLPSA
ncbi:MAG TPA: hypothetical protein DHV08_15480 [Rhodocyclaceae bacterium]|nr:MAG: hypothetical protein AUK49_08265 [Betaproteobacteria bacterium CG2_30_68_42]PJA57500.1 MAG: hypothetical protein CO164_07620 [Rhodocyclales bacterium CG_4_9_14_3_um_filter_68_10]HCX34803.1 hypothetical protein [Rhodocyclaceae bacterium]